jgi:hypothetical protein
LAEGLNLLGCLATGFELDTASVDASLTAFVAACRESRAGILVDARRAAEDILALLRAGTCGKEEIQARARDGLASLGLWSAGESDRPPEE